MKIDDGSEVVGTNVVIATGSLPREIPGFERDGKYVLTSDEVLMMDKLPSSIAVIGGGAIGCEFASMFADTLDAMTTKRPYRGPLGENEVRAELIRCRGKQFDPEIADQLLKNDFWASLFPPANRSESSSKVLRLMVAGAENR